MTMNQVTCPKCKATFALSEKCDQGMDAKGNYVVIYGCSCEVCGFRWSYNYETNVLKAAIK